MGREDHIGHQLRDWRERRRFSQLALASEAGISQRHLSFVETGRAGPSREMVLTLCDSLDVPLEARNALLVAAGFAPQYAMHALDAPQMAAVRATIDRVLAAQMPHPALVVNRLWELQAANRAVEVLLANVAPALLAPPVNVLRLSLHPDGLGSRIGNYGEWRGHVLGRLAREAAASADPALTALHEELAALPRPPGAVMVPPRPGAPDIAVPLRLKTPTGTVSLISLTTVFGTATEVTLAGLAIESFHPADAPSAQILRTLVDP